MRYVGSIVFALLLAAGSAPPARAQEDAHAPVHVAADSVAVDPKAGEPREVGGNVDIITPHITDSRFIDYPCLSSEHGYACEYELPRWEPLRIGSVSIDMSPTKHVVWMLIAAAVAAIVLVSAAAAHRRHAHAAGQRRSGFASGIEAVVLYLREQVVLRNVGPHGEKYVPFVLTLFFFILFANLFGLVPYGSTATGNISVTAALAVLTFIVVEISGMRAQGVGYLSTIFYWNRDLPMYMRIPMFLIMTPVEIVGKFTKPFALAIRLFANMTAGHVFVLALIGLIFAFPKLLIAPLGMSVAIMLLELFVAFLQAFIFALLASVFIGQIRSAHH